MVESESPSAVPVPVAERWPVWSGVLAGLLLLVAVGLVFSSAPQISGSDAAGKITDFYADDGQRARLLPVEFLALLGSFFFLWFLGGLRGALQSWEGVGGRYASPAYAGGVVFVVLTVTAFTAETTVAGTLAFSDSLTLDADTAILLTHLGYVLHAGAMMGAAVTLFATARASRGTSAPRWLELSSYVLGGLSLLSLLMVWLPLSLFLLWVGIVSLKILR